MCLRLPPTLSQAPERDRRGGLETEGPPHTRVLAFIFFVIYFVCFPNNLQGVHTDFIIVKSTTTEKGLTPNIRGAYREATERLKGLTYTHVPSRPVAPVVQTPPSTHS